MLKSFHTFFFVLKLVPAATETYFARFVFRNIGGRIDILKDPESIRIHLEEIQILKLFNFEIQIRSGFANIQLHFVH